MLATTSTVLPQVANAAESGGHYGKAVVLKDVTGDAKVIIKKGYDRKKFKAKFEGKIIILKFIFYGRDLVVVGIIDGTVTVYDKKYFTIDVRSEFKAPADLFKESDDDYDDDDWKYRYRPKPPKDFDLFLDIGWITLEKEIDYHRRDDDDDYKNKRHDDDDDYGKKKVVVIIKINPDEVELDVHGKLKDILGKLAKKRGYHDDDYHGKAASKVELSQ